MLSPFYFFCFVYEITSTSPNAHLAVFDIFRCKINATFLKTAVNYFFSQKRAMDQEWQLKYSNGAILLLNGAREFYESNTSLSCLNHLERAALRFDLNVNILYKAPILNSSFESYCLKREVIGNKVWL